ncbi:21985_t:CDS:2 [Rhizophagus irregularis]|nr:21985_t:CDS:2 [Rhizophagus irregularis]
MRRLEEDNVIPDQIIHDKIRAKGELKNKLEAKEAEYLECKNECDNNDEMITGLG